MILTLALTAGLFALTSSGAEARRAPSLTAKALRNAPIKKVCGGWKGRFHNGVLSDAQQYESIQVARVALGNLDGRGGRDGAIVVRCGTRTPYPDFVVAYTPDRHGRPVLRSVRSLPSIDKTLPSDEGYVSRFRITARRIVARWDSNEPDITGQNADSGVVPTVGRLALRKGTLKVAGLQRQGLRWLVGRFAAAMARKHYAAAAKIGPAWMVTDLKAYPASEWTQKFRWYYGAWQPGDERYKGWAEYTDFSLDLAYDAGPDVWKLQGYDALD